MENIIFSLEVNQIIWGLFGCMTVAIGMLLSIAWSGVREQISALKRMALGFDQKLDKSGHELFKTIEKIKIQQNRQEIMISSIKEQTDKLEIQFSNLVNNIDALPARLAKLKGNNFL